MSTVTQKISIIFPFLKGEASFYPTKLSEIKLQSGIGAAAGFGIEYGVNYGLKLKN